MESKTSDILISEIFKTRNLTLASAESCTGGNIGHKLTLIPGSSSFYKGGVISYTNEVKHNVLGVSQIDLDNYGAVSQPVAEQMAQGACRIMNADFAVSTTGVAGPTGGTDENPVGTVWMAVSNGTETISKKFRFSGNRAEIIENATYSAFFLLKEFVEK